MQGMGSSKFEKKTQFLMNEHPVPGCGENNAKLEDKAAGPKADVANQLFPVPYLGQLTYHVAASAVPRHSLGIMLLSVPYVGTV